MAATATKKKTSLAHRLYTGEIGYEFVGKRKRWYTVSLIVVTLCLVLVGVRGLNLSIDFTGGSEFTVPAPVTATTVDDYREVVQGLDLPDLGEVKTNTIGDNQVRVQVRALSADEINVVTAALAEHAGLQTSEVTNNLIGGSWGQQITEKGITALVVFLVLVGLMIWIYFRNWKMSVAALVALAHDLVVVVGVYALLQFTFSPSSLIGLLTILGYSLYDTVVVFDRIRENIADLPSKTRTISQLTNTAVNQVLVRSINTTIIGVLPVAALLVAGTFILGTGPLKDLGLALFIGMIAGAYSSLFLAAPLFADMKEREPEAIEHRERLERRSTRSKKQPDATAVVAQEVLTPTGEAVPVSNATVVDPVVLGAVRPDQVQQVRQQPRHNSRADRRKDSR